MDSISPPPVESEAAVLQVASKPGKRRILFVDDDPAVLQGLARALFRMRDQWDCDYVAGPPEALALLGQRPYDVIVSDVRLENADGVELLKDVRSRYPAVVRILLTGNAEAATPLRSVGVAHQFLTKPCEGAVVQEVINRACALQGLLAQRSLRAVAGRFESLPVRSAVFEKLLSLLSDPDASLSEVVKVINLDLGLSAKVLQAAQLLRLRTRVTSVDRAVTCLGMESVKSVVASSDVLSRITQKQRIDEQTLKSMHAHATAVGGLAKLLLADKPRDAEAAFLAGTFHDLGRLVQACYASRELAQGRRPAAIHRELGRAESADELVSHAHVGGYLLGLWNMDPVIVEAVAFHHSADHMPSELNPTSAVYLAECLLQSETEDPLAALDPNVIERLGDHFNPSECLAHLRFVRESQGEST